MGQVVGSQRAVSGGRVLRPLLVMIANGWNGPASLTTSQPPRNSAAPKSSSKRFLTHLLSTHVPRREPGLWNFNHRASTVTLTPT